MKKSKTFSNSNGTINLAGGIPNPGFNGTGDIVTINFKSKKAGEANINILGGQILADDGKGTDIMSFLKGATYIIYPAIGKEVSAESIGPAVPEPEILLYPKNHISGEELFYVEGKALPDSTVIIFLKKNENIIKAWEKLADENGKWFLSTAELIKTGDYILSAKDKNQSGEFSSFSSGYRVNVQLLGFSLGPWTILYSTLSIILIILIVLVTPIIIIFYYFKIRKSKEKLKKEIKEAKESLENTFIELRKILTKKIEYLDSKPGLNPEEKKLRDEIFYILKNSEGIVSKEIDDIKRELKD